MVTEQRIAELRDASYGTVLGEYFLTAKEIGRLLNGSGIPRPNHRAEYARLKRRKSQLRAILDRVEPDHETTDIQAALTEALAHKPTTAE